MRQTGKTYDRFRGRLMFPLVDHRGRVVGFGGRTLKDENPKYLNSPEGPLYQKGHLLYGLYQARRAIAEADEVVVVEGYTDVLGLAQAGVKNVVASMGTSLTDAQIGLMMRFTSNVTFMFDADRAGTEAMLRSGELARGHSLRPRVAVLPAGKDPADIAVQGGQEQVSRVMAGKMSLLGFELRQALDRSDTATADGRVRAFEEVRRIMERAVSLKEREEEIPIVADRLGSPPTAWRSCCAARPRRQAGAGRPAAGGRHAPAWPRGCWATRPSSSGSSWSRRRATPAGPRPCCRPSPRSISPTRATARSSWACARRSPPVERRRRTAAGGRWPVSEPRAHGDSEAGRLFVRLVMEADQERYSVAVLDELHLRLQEQYFRRTIAALRGRLDEGGDVQQGAAPALPSGAAAGRA